MTVPDLAVTEPAGADGAPVVLLGPSLGTASAVLWEDVIPALSRTYRVATWDLPGHGASGPPADPFTVEEIADALAEAIRSFGGPVLAAGVSLGGAVTQALAIRHGELLRAAAVICTAANFAAGADAWHERAAKVRAQGTSVLIGSSAERWFAPGSIAARPDITGRLLHTLADASDEGYAACCEALADFDVREELGSVTVPLLVVYGEEDQATPRANAEEIATTVPGARLVGIADAAHLPTAEKPDEVAAELLAFFEGNAR
ncbi:alpha/beta fold hydrolase [Microbacterium karelineae]|uniref:alpha/beta fold hydrolase n=1 Tax=Microbacterium karelineae TaxID=2654283 RepID=UPI0012EA97C3|nr:alpha/beta fold hydrolase [Microbacterium karelineae]